MKRFISFYDGFYCVATNLEDDVSEIIRVNHRRWETEESFRIMKTEFSARPVYLSRDDRITAHFTTCFLALAVYRYFEKAMGHKYTCTELLEQLKSIREPLNKSRCADAAANFLSDDTN